MADSRIYLGDSKNPNGGRNSGVSSCAVVELLRNAVTRSVKRTVRSGQVSRLSLVLQAYSVATLRVGPAHSLPLVGGFAPTVIGSCCGAGFTTWTRA